MNIRPKDIYDMLSSYHYEFKRPNQLPNLDKICDSSLFIAWYLQYVFGVNYIMNEDTTTWTIYASLIYSKRLFYEGLVSQLDTSRLRNGDIVICSVNPTFNTPDPENYWCGVYWDKNTFMNFNAIEQFGIQPLDVYLNSWMDYRYIAVFRIRNIAAYPQVGLNPNRPPE